MDMKQSMAGDNEAHFVFVVPVFAPELCQHRFEARRFGIDIDHIGGYITAAGLQLIDLFGIRRQNLFCRRVVANGVAGWPSLVIDAESCQVLSDRPFVAERLIVIGYPHKSHHSIPKN